MDELWVVEWAYGSDWLIDRTGEVVYTSEAAALSHAKFEMMPGELYRVRRFVAAEEKA